MATVLGKVGVLAAKDAKDLLRNPTMLVTCLLPVAFMLFFRYVAGSQLGDAADAAEVQRALDGYLLASGLCLSVSVVPPMTLIYGIAEEKEKRTLRTLMLANVGGNEIILSKCIVSVAATAVVVELLCFAVSGAQVEMLAPYLALGVVGALPVVLLSIVLGLMSRDQMTAGMYSIPVLLLAILPMFANYSDALANVVQFAPLGGIVDLLDLAYAGNLFGADALAPVAITLAWVAACLAICLALYRRLLRDN